MIRTHLALAAALLCCIGPVLAAAPADTVNQFHTTLTASMAEGPKLGCDGRLARMQPAVAEAYDLPFIAERALRRHWKTLDEAQKTTFRAALERSFVTTYATEFAKPDAARFTTGATDTLANGDAVVHTTLKPQSGDAVSLDYVLKNREGRWRVVNVLAEGVSDLALRATQYDGLMKTQGFAALMTRLDAQTQKLKARCP